MEPSFFWNQDAFLHEKTVFLDIDEVIWQYNRDTHGLDLLHPNEMYSFFSFLRENNVNICFLTHGRWTEEIFKQGFKHDISSFNFQLINSSISDDLDYINFIKKSFSSYVTVLPDDENDFIEIMKEQLACYPEQYPKITEMMFVCKKFGLDPRKCILIDDQDFNITSILEKKHIVTELYRSEEDEPITQDNPIILTYRSEFEAFQYDHKTHTPLDLIEQVKAKLNITVAETKVTDDEEAKFSTVLLFSRSSAFSTDSKKTCTPPLPKKIKLS